MIPFAIFGRLKARLTRGDSERDGLFCQDGACCQILDVTGVVIPAVLRCQMGKVQVAILPHDYPFTELDVE